MPTINTTVIPIPVGFFKGGIEIVENGEKRAIWSSKTRLTEKDAYNDADELKEAYDDNNRIRR